MIEQQGLQGVWLFPTLGVLYEEVIKHDVDAVVMMMQAFNQWLHDDWTFNYENTIFAAPYLALGDIDAAVAEVDKVLGMGANVPSCALPSPPAPVWCPPTRCSTRYGLASIVGRAAGDPRSRLWLLIAGLRRRCSSLAGRWRRPVAQGVRYRNAAQDWLIQAVFEKIFDRFPNLRFASIENGSDFLGPMFEFDQTAKKSYWWFDNHPVDTFKQHVWVNPFWEDDVDEVVELWCRSGDLWF